MTTDQRKLTIQAVLEFLTAAGPDGATTTVIAEAFNYPADYHQRSNRVSQILLKLAGRGHAEKTGTERSHRYKHSWVSRWRITPAGEKAGRTRENRAQAHAAQAARMEQAATARVLALAAVRAEMTNLVREDGLAAITPGYRVARIRQLRAVPCTLTEIGELFGLTKERVRQIEMPGTVPGR
jgi:hypothetical protein